MIAVIEADTRANGVPLNPCAELMDRIESERVTDTAVAYIKALASVSDESLRHELSSLVRWAVIDAYYAGLQAARKAR